MSEESLKKRGSKHGFSQLARFWRREGRRYCAVALCASLIAGNIGYMAVAASDEPDYKFELDRVALYEALQQAVADGNTVDGDFEFAGMEADTYEISMAADGSLYELTPEIDDNNGSLYLRVFARLDENIDLVDDVFDEIGNGTTSVYEIDGSEAFYFLLTNTSDKEQTAIISVGEKETEVISVIPHSAVEMPEPEGKAAVHSLNSNTVQAGAETAGDAGPGVTDAEKAGETGSGSITAGNHSGSSGNGGGGGSSGTASVENPTEVPETETETSVENSMEAATPETEAEGKVESTEAETKEPEIEIPETGTPGKESEADVPQESDASAGSEDRAEKETDAPEVESPGKENDVEIEIENGDSAGDSNITEESDVFVVEDEKFGSLENDTDSNSNAADDSDDDSGNDSGNTADPGTDDSTDENSQNESSDTSDGGNAESADAAMISWHKTYRVASGKASPSNATPSDADEEEELATDSNATDSDAMKDVLDGTVLDAVRMGEDSTVLFMTTAEELKISNELEKFASPSNAGRLYEASLDTGLMVQVYANEGAFEEDVELSVKELKEDDEETAEDYQAAKDALDAENTEYTGMIALDISFLNDAGDEVEPKNGSVQVCIEMAKEILPEDVIEETLSVKHLEENWLGNIKKVHTVADNADAEAANVDVNAEDAVVTAEFEVESFSTFTITWRNEGRTLNVRYVTVGSNGSYENLELRDVTSGPIQVDSGFNFSTYAPSTATGQDGKEYSFVSAVLNTGNGEFKYNDVSSNAFRTDWSGGTRILQYYAPNSWGYGGQWTEVSNDSMVYLVYGISELLPTFQGKDTSGRINIHVKNLDKNSKAGGFQFGQFGEGTGINDWTGNGGGVRQGIIKETLNAQGYPDLKSSKNSLDNFFTDGVNANNLFLKDKDGYYHYDSNEHFAALDTGTGIFSLYGKDGEEGYGITHAKNITDANGKKIEFDSGTIPQFMPFNTLKSPWGKYEKENSEYYGYQFAEKEDYYFSMMVDFDFIMPKDGMVNGQPMVFEFDGDDDVWVFIDNVLVLDMGGVHLSCGGSINFATGEVQVARVYENGETTQPPTAYIYNLFDKAEQDGNVKWSETEDGDRIFKDYSTHTLKFFYLERGAGGSNCKLKFNLPPIPEGTINFQKDLVYTNVADASDLDFEFKTYVNYSGDDNGTYELYTGPYEIYNVNNLNNSIVSGTVGRDGVLKLKDGQMARLLNPSSGVDENRKITALSKFYVQEIGATSDKYEVKIDDVKVTQKTGDSSSNFSGAETEKLVVGNNPYIVFENRVVADNQFNLQIQKKMSDGTSPDTEFEFELLLGTNEAKYTGKYVVHHADNTSEVLEATEDGILRFKAGEYAEVVGLVGGNTIKVQEVNLGDAYGTPTYAISGALAENTAEQNGYAKGTALEGTALKNAGGKITVTVTNHPKPDLTIKKTVAGILGDRNKEFQFTIEVKDQDGNQVYVDGTYDVDGTNEKITIAGGNFTLKHGQEIKIPNTKLPINAYCEVAETDYNGYTTTVKIGDVVQESRIAKIGELVRSTTIEFTNTKGGRVDTGILLDSMPYVLILGAVAAGIAFYFIRKKKDDEDDLD